MEPGTPERAGPSACSACGAPFKCGAEAGEPSCWCFELAKLEPVPGRSCLCPGCLREELARNAKA